MFLYPLDPVADVLGDVYAANVVRFCENISCVVLYSSTSNASEKGACIASVRTEGCFRSKGENQSRHMSSASVTIIVRVAIGPSAGPDLDSAKEACWGCAKDPFARLHMLGPVREEVLDRHIMATGPAVEWPFCDHLYLAISFFNRFRDSIDWRKMNERPTLLHVVGDVPTCWRDRSGNLECCRRHPLIARDVPEVFWKE